jgi:hypothetical protein
MSKKDYELIAGVLKQQYGNMVFRSGADAWSELVIQFATTLAANNPRFDRARFLKACGL